MRVYSLLTMVVQPRPIAFVSTISDTGIHNLAPFSFFMLGGANPPSLMISPTVDRSLKEKDTLTNIRANGEFVVNTVHREIVDGMNQTSAAIPSHESEWDLCRFIQVPSDKVKPPRVGESKVNLECKLFQIVEHGSGPASARYVIGEVVAMHFQKQLFEGDNLVAENLRLVSRMGGADYLDTGALEFFQLPRP